MPLHHDLAPALLVQCRLVANAEGRRNDFSVPAHRSSSYSSISTSGTVNSTLTGGGTCPMTTAFFGLVSICLIRYPTACSIATPCPTSALIAMPFQAHSTPSTVARAPATTRWFNGSDRSASVSIVTLSPLIFIPTLLLLSWHHHSSLPPNPTPPPPAPSLQPPAPHPP